jgi:hypothetical protein
MTFFNLMRILKMILYNKFKIQLLIIQKKLERFNKETYKEYKNIQCKIYELQIDNCRDFT